ncbi:hypothetical protein CEQ90_14755 [Lewinellaceae bacterium SD302]|nr:hypothetical protein CEQ90_14755 [Lewinellaceae bacterium SD302]
MPVAAASVAISAALTCAYGVPPAASFFIFFNNFNINQSFYLRNKAFRSLKQYFFLNAFSVRFELPALMSGPSLNYIVSRYSWRSLGAEPEHVALSMSL